MTDPSPSAELPEIVLVSVAEIGSGALEAHLGELARRLSRHATVHWAALASPRLMASRAGRTLLDAFSARARPGLSGRLLVMPHGPRFSGLGAAGRVLAWRLRRAGIGRGRLVLHARGYLATLTALSARAALPGSAVLHDVRGDRPAEVRIHGGESAPDVVEGLERVACAGADGHLAVSRALAELLKRRHGVRADVFCSAADTDAFRPDPEGGRRVRRELGLGGDPVLGFIGSCAPWQRPDGAVAVLRAWRRRRPSARLLVLSPDASAWASELRRLSVRADLPGSPAPDAEAFVRRAPHHEVPAWISACDATALLRDDDDVNRVASPIKFGESIACGVPVLLTRGIGDTSEAVERHGAGAAFGDALLRAPGDEERLARFLDGIETDAEAARWRCRRLAEDQWSWDSQMDARLRAYRRLAA